MSTWILTMMYLKPRPQANRPSVYKKPLNQLRFETPPREFFCHKRIRIDD